MPLRSSTGVLVTWVLAAVGRDPVDVGPLLVGVIDRAVLAEGDAVDGRLDVGQLDHLGLGGQVDGQQLLAVAGAGVEDAALGVEGEAQGLAAEVHPLQLGGGVGRPVAAQEPGAAGAEGLGEVDGPVGRDHEAFGRLDGVELRARALPHPPAAGRRRLRRAPRRAPAARRPAAGSGQRGKPSSRSETQSRPGDFMRSFPVGPRREDRGRRPLPRPAGHLATGLQVGRPIGRGAPTPCFRGPRERKVNRRASRPLGSGLPSPDWPPGGSRRTWPGKLCLIQVPMS